MAKPVITDKPVLEQAEFNGVTIWRKEGGSIEVSDTNYPSVTAAIKDIASKAGVVLEDKWNTQYAGWYLIQQLKGKKPTASVTPAPKAEAEATSYKATVPSIEVNTIDWEVFEENGKKGYKDENGKIVIPCMYDEFFWRWQDGLIMVGIDGKKGFINTNNTLIVPAKYDYISYEREIKMFICEDGDNKGVVDFDGKVIIPLFECGDILWDDVIELFKVEIENLSGYIDSSNKIVVPIEYLETTAVEDSQQIIAKKGEGWHNAKDGVISRTGDIVVPFEYDKIKWSDKTQSYLVEKDGKVGFILPSGGILIPIEYDSAHEDRDGLVISKDGKSYPVGNDGIIEKESPYDTIQDFDRGTDLALARRNGKWGYVNKEHKEIVPCDKEAYVISVFCEARYASYAPVPERDDLLEYYGLNDHKINEDEDYEITRENVGELLKLCGEDFWNNVGSTKCFIENVDSLLLWKMETENWFRSVKGCKNVASYNSNEVDIKYEELDIPNKGILGTYSMGKFGHFYLLLIPDFDKLDPSKIKIENKDEHFKVSYDGTELKYLGNGMSDDGDIMENLRIFMDGKECEVPEN